LSSAVRSYLPCAGQARSPLACAPHQHQESKPSLTTRRHFLKLLGSTAAASCLAIECGSSPEGASPASGPVAAGNINSVPVGYLSFVGGKPVVLGRDANGLYALSAICTHQQCDMSRDGSISGDGIVCACHGSHFSATGAAESGPAHSPLDHYAVELAANGSITVHAGVIVSAATRTPVASG
jgi:nitrite reductase/ring-hydroxylating ferredoxin subunit